MSEDSGITLRYTGRFLILLIPVINVIMCFIWSFTSEDYETRAFGRGALIAILIVIAIASLGAVLGYNSLLKLLNSIAL